MTPKSRHRVVSDRAELRSLIAGGHAVHGIRRARGGVVFLLTKTPVLRLLAERLGRAGLSWMVEGEGESEMSNGK